MSEPTPNDRALALENLVTQRLRVAMAEKGAKWFAAECGLQQNTLLHQLEPEREGDRITWRTFWRILVRIDPTQVLRPLALELGGQYIPPVKAGALPGDLHRLMSEAAREFGDVADALLAATAPDSPGGAAWTPDEIEHLEQQAEEAVAKMRQIVRAARESQVVPLTRPRRA